MMMIEGCGLVGGECEVIKRRVKTPQVSCLSRMANGNRIRVAFRKLKGKSYKN